MKERVFEFVPSTQQRHLAKLLWQLRSSAAAHEEDQGGGADARHTHSQGHTEGEPGGSGRGSVSEGEGGEPAAHREGSASEAEGGTAREKEGPGHRRNGEGQGYTSGQGGASAGERKREGEAGERLHEDAQPLSLSEAQGREPQGVRREGRAIELRDLMEGAPIFSSPQLSVALLSPDGALKW